MTVTLGPVVLSSTDTLLKLQSNSTGGCEGEGESQRGGVGGKPKGGGGCDRLDPCIGW